MSRTATAQRAAAQAVPRKKHHFIAKLIVLGVIFVLLAVGGFYALNHYWLPMRAATTSFPPENPVGQVSTVYAANGAKIGKFGDSLNHRELTPANTSPYLALAVQAAENNKFYTDNGIDAEGTAKAIIRSRGHAGGSTITQQLIKNKYLLAERTGSNRRNTGAKEMEAVLAYKLTKSENKDDILLDYLNIVPMGRANAGMGAACRDYFGVSCAKITPAQAALLASMLRAPNGFVDSDSIYDGQEARATVIRNAVLARMQILSASMPHPSPNGYWDYPTITVAQLKQYQAEPIKAGHHLSGASITNSWVASPYFMNAVAKYLEAKYGSQDNPRDVLSRGLKIYTTYSGRCESAMENAVNSVSGGRLEPRVGMSAMNTHTGAIPCLYGGESYSKQAYDASWQSTRQAASTMKAAVLTRAVQLGIPVTQRYAAPPCVTVFPDSTEVTLSCNEKNKPEGGVFVHNFINESWSHKLTLEQCTWYSVNTCYVQVMQDIKKIDGSYDDVADLAHDMGADAMLFDYQQQPEVPASILLPLGVNSVSTVGLNTMFATLANRGTRVSPMLITKIVTSDGEVIEQNEPDVTENVVEPWVADTVNSVLHRNMRFGTASAARISHQAAGKTGTADNRDTLRFAGYTPDLAANAWIGMTNPTPLKSVFGLQPTGGGTAGLMWARFMERYTASLPDTPFTKPSPPTPTASQSETPTPTISDTPIVVETPTVEVTTPEVVPLPPSELPSTEPALPTEEPSPTDIPSMSPTASETTPVDDDTGTATLTPVGPTPTQSY